jgi:ADP-ribose pyrophosphatase
MCLVWLAINCRGGNEASKSMPIKVLHRGTHLSLVRRGTWEYVTRPGVTGIVGILAVTTEGRLLLVEQYRPPVGKRVIEIPAGLAGDGADVAGEELAAAAARELEEETGYRAGRMELLASGPPSAGVSDEMIALYRAHEVKKVSAGGGDEHEDITVHEVAVGEVEGFLEEKRKQGLLVDLKVYAGMYFVGRDGGT